MHHCRPISSRGKQKHHFSHTIVPPMDTFDSQHRTTTHRFRQTRIQSQHNRFAESATERARSGTPHLVNKQLVLPFVPPSFPQTGDSNRLIKPSEYLRSIGDRRSSATSSKQSSDIEDNYMVVSQPVERCASEGPAAFPPPPPPPPPSEKVEERHQPLSTISIRDLNSVRLRRTDKMIASKTLSAPVRSVSMQCLATSEPFQAQKTDLIAELKMSKDITGIKKMKVERAKMENMVDKEVYSEFTKQFTANNFVEKVSFFFILISRI